MKRMNHTLALDLLMGIDLLLFGKGNVKEQEKKEGKDMMIFQAGNELMICRQE